MYTDHRPLKRGLNLQETRWAVKMSEYNYTVELRPGTQMRHADALSRSVNAVEKDLVLSREVIKAGMTRRCHLTLM